MQDQDGQNNNKFYIKQMNLELEEFEKLRKYCETFRAKAEVTGISESINNWRKSVTTLKRVIIEVYWNVFIGFIFPENYSESSRKNYKPLKKLRMKWQPTKPRIHRIQNCFT